MSSMEVSIRIDGKEHYRALVWPLPNVPKYLASECERGTENLKELGKIEHDRTDGTLKLAQKVLEASIRKRECGP